MFKCVDCGMEYEIKPDFCDCGNNVFEEIKLQPKPTSQQASKSEPKPKHKKTFDEQYPELSSFMETLDPISVCIFVLCIILSIASLIFIKPKEQPETAQKEEVKIERKVADIESFWNDAPPKIQQVAPKQQEPTIANQITNMISQITDSKPAQTTQKPAPQTNVQKPKLAAQTKTQQKPQQKPQQKRQATQPKTQTKTSTTQNKPASAKPAQQTQQKPQQTQQPQKPVQQVQQKPQQTAQQTTQQHTVNNAEVQAQAAAKAAQELKTYKTGLRNTLFSKLNFTRVYGDGDCIVVFKVDSTGRLTNKSFSKQSTNNTLNDEVYQAIMSTPVYKAPPSSYHNETLHFSVKFRGGQYEVSLY